MKEGFQLFLMASWRNVGGGGGGGKLNHLVGKLDHLGGKLNHLVGKLDQLGGGGGGGEA